MKKGQSSDDPRRDKRASEARETGIDPELLEDLGAQLLPDRVDAAELADAREQAERSHATALHWQAEFENYRKRQERDAADQRVRATERIVSELLPVLDDLDRAIGHTVESAAHGAELDQLLKGVEMVRDRILGVFSKEGVEVVDPFGSVFDPHEAQAIGQREDAEFPEHTVVEVYQKGYRLGGRVVRPAMVIVSTGGPSGVPDKE
jgi:molecular chaperone GrpE